MRGTLVALGRCARLVAAAGLVAALLAALLLRWDYSYRPGSLVPLALVRDRHGSPEAWVAALIQREGGLPKVATALTHYDAGPEQAIGVSAGAKVFPVATWRVERVSLTAPYSLLSGVLRREVAYSIAVDIRVWYGDGDTALLRWDTWRYGWQLGPIALDEGGGPAGDIVVAG